MTSTGLLLIPLGLALLLLPRQFLLMALPAFALFHGAAVLNIGSVGLQPGYFLALLLIGRTIAEVSLLRQPLDRHALGAVAPLALVVLIGVVVLWISIAFFAGKVVVIGGTDGYDLSRARPYQFRRENLAQLTYIVINTALVYAIAHQAAQIQPARFLRIVDRGVVLAVVLALLFSLWQLLAHATGIYYPADFLFTNAGYYRADSQGFFGYIRLNGPFAEPSALAYFCAGFLFYAWKRRRLSRSVTSTMLIIALIAAIGLAFSTTGYFMLAAFALLAAFDTLMASRASFWPLRLTWRFAASSVLMVGAIVAAAVWIFANREGLADVLDISLFEKTQTSSFEVRRQAELMALDILVETGGIGIGLGSHKPNSLTLTLVSNLGLVGTAVFGGFVLMLLWPQQRAREDANGHAGRPEDPLRFWIIGLLIVHSFSNPNFNVAMLWIAFGMMAGYRAAWRRGLERAPAPPVPMLHDRWLQPARPEVSRRSARAD